MARILNQRNILQFLCLLLTYNKDKKWQQLSLKDNTTSQLCANVNLKEYKLFLSLKFSQQAHFGNCFNSLLWENCLLFKEMVQSIFYFYTIGINIMRYSILFVLLISLHSFGYEQLRFFDKHWIKIIIFALIARITILQIVLYHILMDSELKACQKCHKHFTFDKRNKK